jgi:hypothetical protein
LDREQRKSLLRTNLEIFAPKPDEYYNDLEEFLTNMQFPEMGTFRREFRPTKVAYINQVGELHKEMESLDLQLLDVIAVDFEYFNRDSWDGNLFINGRDRFSS